LEPLEFVRTLRIVDYGDLAAATSGQLELAEHLSCDEETIQQQRQDIAGKYGLTTMIENIVRVYASYGVQVR
jgi:hypothetical protein